MNKLNDEQLNTWNQLRFGSQHPKLIRQEFKKILCSDMRKYGYKFSQEDNKKFAINLFWVPTNKSKHFYELINVEDDLYGFHLTYNKTFHNWVYTPEDNSDITIVIGWCPLDNKPDLLIFNNRFNSDDCIKIVAINDTPKEIAREFEDFLFYALVEKFNSKKLHTRWVEKTFN